MALLPFQWAEMFEGRRLHEALLPALALRLLLCALLHEVPRRDRLSSQVERGVLRSRGLSILAAVLLAQYLFQLLLLKKDGVV